MKYTLIEKLDAVKLANEVGSAQASEILAIPEFTIISWCNKFSNKSDIRKAIGEYASEHGVKATAETFSVSAKTIYRYMDENNIISSKKHTKSEILKIVALSDKIGNKATCEKLGIPAQTLNTWRKKYRKPQQSDNIIQLFLAESGLSINDLCAHLDFNRNQVTSYIHSSPYFSKYVCALIVRKLYTTGVISDDIYNKYWHLARQSQV